MAKFMLSLRDENFQLLITESQERGITIQELIRAVIIPDWVKHTTLLKTPSNGTSLTNRLGSGNGNGRETIIQPINRVKRFGNSSYSSQI